MVSRLNACLGQAQDRVGAKAQLLCAECLGLLGAIDPARLDMKAEPPKSLHSLTLPLLKELISRHLVRLLRVATSLPVLEATTYAIQACSTFEAIFPMGCAVGIDCRSRHSSLDAVQEE